ncbi:MAG: ABC-type glycerol-3-phosphate transport system substrate-binding protein [Candidatus Azotimanducaceae bacterium]|jgi:ABC-type glycerol-3-phosphate transport system substrate-binding protein
MSNLRPFQIITLAVFVALAIVSILLLSGFSPSGSEDDATYGDRVVIWGVLEARVFNEAIDEIGNSDEAFEVVSYRQIDSRSFDDILVNAIAEGNSPDLVLLPGSKLVHNRSKLSAFSSETISEGDFSNTYIDGAEIFARPDGVYALPLAVDPIVMYWNKDMFANNGLAQAPSTWESVVSTVAPALIQTDNNRNLQQSALAFGEVRNVQNAKEILLLLALQSGSKMVYEQNGQYVIELNKSRSGNGLPPLEASAQFFTNFSNANNQLYSWNRSQPLDKNMFVAGNLGLYFGFGSELDSIVSKNPNLSFDMAAVPQGASATIRRTYGEFYGFAIPKASQNKQGALLVAKKFTSSDVSAYISELFKMAPASRNAVAAGSSDTYRQIILNSALIARGWLDPGSAQTDKVFQDMIENVSSGRMQLNAAVRDAELKLQLIF